MDTTEITKEIENYPETIFDTFDLGLSKYHGSGLRDRLGEMSNIYSRINRLVANVTKLYEDATNRLEEVEALAWGRVDIGMKVTQKKIAVKSIPVEIGGERTTINQEKTRVTLYRYVYNRGKFIQNEISDQLDLGRTLLSWDKSELDKTQYS